MIVNTWYRGYWIDKYNNGYTVLYEGDEIYFKTVRDAQHFINAVNPIEYGIEDLEEVAHVLSNGSVITD